MFTQSSCNYNGASETLDDAVRFGIAHLPGCACFEAFDAAKYFHVLPATGRCVRTGDPGSALQFRYASLNILEFQRLHSLVHDAFGRSHPRGVGGILIHHDLLQQRCGSCRGTLLQACHRLRKGRAPRFPKSILKLGHLQPPQERFGINPDGPGGFLHIALGQQGRNRFLLLRGSQMPADVRS